MKRKLGQRLLASLLTLCMVLPYAPTAALAATDASVTLTTTYKGVERIDGVTVTDETPITLTVSYTKPQSTGYSLELDLPYGIELDGTNNTYYPPGIATINNNISNKDHAVTYETKYATDFIAEKFATNGAGSVMPIWKNKELPKDAQSNTGISSVSGKLIYGLSGNNGSSFTFNIKVNRAFLVMDDDEAVTQLLGSIKASIGTDTSGDISIDDGGTLASTTLDVKATAQAANVHFENTSVSEYPGNSLSSVYKTSLMEGNVNQVMLSTRLVVNPPFDGYSIPSNVHRSAFILTLPEGATAKTGNGTYYSVSANPDSNPATNDWLVKSNSTNLGITFNEGKNYINMLNCALITLDEGTVVADETILFTVSDISFRLRNGKLNDTGTKFESVDYTAPASHEDKTQTTTIDVVAAESTYALLQYDFSSANHQYNNYYDFDTNPDFSTYWDKLETTKDGLQQLMCIRRGFATAGGPDTDASISLKPVKFSMVANKVNCHGAEGYLDFVTQMNLNVPFLGNIAPRQSSKLTSLVIKTEVYDRDSVGAAYPYTDTTATMPTPIDGITMENGIKTYTIPSEDIETFMSSITGAEAQIGSGYDFDSGVKIGDFGIASYCWDSSPARSPMFFVQAPENESIISVEATFTGDTDSFCATSATYANKVWGYPKLPTITYDKLADTTYLDGITSSYTYNITQDTDEDGTFEAVSNFPQTGGFVWEAPVTFDFEVKNTHNNLTYMYSATQANFVSGGYDTNHSEKGLKGYQNLASISLKNTTGALPKAPFTAKGEIGTIGDVVKEVFFPYAADFSEITSMTYTLFKHEDTDSDGKIDTYTLEMDGDTAKVYDGLLEDDYTLLSSYGILVAPEGYSFASFDITVDGWTDADTASSLAFHGYLKDSNELATVDATDSYTFTVETETQTQTVSNSDSKFTTNSETYTATRVLGTLGTPIGSETVNSPCNILMPGVSTDVSVMVFGGQVNDPYNSAWHDITFTIALPSGIQLEDLTLGNHHLEFNSGVVFPPSGVEDTAIITGETLDKKDYEVTSNLGVAVDDHFATAKLSQPTQANIYTYTLTDEDFALYWTRHATCNTENHSTFTITMTLKADSNIEDIAVPWSDILILGTNDSKISTFTSFVTDGNKNKYVGSSVSAFTGPLTTGVTGNVVGDSNAYLYASQNPMLLVHKAHIEKDGTEYHYSEGNAESLASFTHGESGILHFTVTDTVPDTVAGTNYVLMPLPTLEGINALQTKADFAVTLGAVTTISTDSAAACAVKYVALSQSDITKLNSAALATLAGGASSTYTPGTHNAILLEITAQKQFSDIIVSVPFTAPSTDEPVNKPEIVTFSAMSSYYTDSTSQSLYYAGTAPSNVASKNVGTNFVSCEYYYPQWDLTYAGVLDNKHIPNTAITNATPEGADTIKMNNETLAMPSAPANPTGYVFKNWYIDADLSKKFVDGTVITADTTLYAKFDELSFSVAYDYEDDFGATAPVEQTLYWTDALGELPEGAERTGYTFLGWYIGNTKITDVTTYQSLDTTAADNVILIGKYEAIDYAVTYNTLSGTGTITPNPTLFAWDKPFALPAQTITLDGHTFEGWALTEGATATNKIVVTDETYGEMAFAEETTQAVTLYAIWTEKEYTIEFDLNDGTDTSTPDSYSDLTVTWDHVFTSTDLDEPERTGYTFQGWYYGAEKMSVGHAYASDIGVESDESPITLTAKWKANQYDVIFDDGISGTLDTTHTVDYDAATLTLPNPAPTKDGYTFQSWNTKADGTGTPVTAGTAFCNICDPSDVDDVTVHAVWTAIKYQITFANPTGKEDYGTLPTTNPYEIEWDTVPFVLPTPTDVKDGQTFLHWDYVDGEDHYPITIGTGDIYGTTVGALTDATSVTLEAHYAENIYTIHFESNVVAFSKVDLTEDWDDVFTLDAPVIEGYTFEGWYSDAGYSQAVTSPQLSTLFPGRDDEDNFTLYAKYNETIYNISFDTKGGSDITNLEPVNWTTSITQLPTPTKMGYTFDAWYEDQACTDHKVAVPTDSSTFETLFGSNFGAATDPENPHIYTCTLYPGWTANEYTLTLDAQNGEDSTTQTHVWPGEDFQLDALYQTGYTFKEWNTAKDGSGTRFGGDPLNFEEINNAFSAKTAASRTLYAQYVENSYDIILKPGSGATVTPDTIDDVMWTAKVPALPDAVMMGYQFVSWKNGIAANVVEGDNFSAAASDSKGDSLMEYGALTLYANFEPNDYDLTLVYQDDVTPDSSTSCSWDALNVFLPTPTRTGYDFGGWYTKTSGGEKVESGTAYTDLNSKFSTTVAADRTLFAQWTPKTFTIHFVYEETVEGNLVTGTDTTLTSKDVKWTENIALNAVVPNSSAYHFANWQYNGTALPLTGTLGDVFSDDSNEILTLKAHYAENIVTVYYETPFDGDSFMAEGTKEWKTLTLGATDALTLTYPEHDGYTFDGWYTEADDQITTGTVAKGFTDHTHGAENTLLAKYTENLYDVYYDAKGGSAVEAQKDYKWTTTVAFPEAPTYPGHTFTNWFRNPDGQTDKAIEGQAYGKTFGHADVDTQTLYAGWSVNRYTVKFDLVGGSGTATTATDKQWDDAILLPAGITKLGYDFGGWSTEWGDTLAAGTTTTYATIGGADVEGTVVTLTAIWTAKTDFVPVYNLNYTTSIPTPTGTEMAWDDTFTFPTAPQRTGFQFSGWYTEAACINQVTTQMTYGDVATSDLGWITLYAKWTEGNCTVHYDESTGIASVKINDYEAIPLTPVIPIKEGCHFMDWYYHETPSSAPVKVTGNTLFNTLTSEDEITLIPHWRMNTPTAQVDYTNEKLTGLSNGDYTITADSETITVTITDGTLDISNYFGKEINLIKVAIDENTLNSVSQKITLVARPEIPTSSLTPGSYMGGQPFDMACVTANANIYYHITEGTHNLVQDGFYSPTKSYAIKKDATLTLYSIIPIGFPGAGLKSLVNTYTYEITPNLTVMHGDNAPAPTHKMIVSIGGATSDVDGLIAASEYQNFGLIKIDDTNATDDTGVTNAEREALNGKLAELIGYTEHSAFHLHATVNNEIIYDTVDLSTTVSVIIPLKNFSSGMTYQILHMKHDGDHADDVEVFSVGSGLTVDKTNGTLTMSGLTSLSPFMVVEKKTSTSGGIRPSVTPSTKPQDNLLNTEDHMAYMIGGTDGNFNPNANITRAETIVMFSRLMKEPMNADKVYPSPFSDVTDTCWYANEVGYMAQFGIIKGYADGTFGGNQPITRAEFATVASRFSELLATDENPFSDVPNTHWAVGYITSASAHGWVTGYEDGTFAPDQNISRSEAVTLVNRVLGRNCDLDFVTKCLDEMTTFPDVVKTHWAYDQILEAANSHQYTKDDEGIETWSDLIP